MRRSLWIVLATVVAVVALVVGLADWALDPGSLKPRLVEAAERATGRTLTISGPIHLKLSLVPTISMENVALSNPPGFSRPEMVTVGRVELGLALLPLLRHRFEIDHVTLVRPDILLEAGQAGHPNWVFTRGTPKIASGPRIAREAPPADVPASRAPARNPSEGSPVAAGTANRRFTPELRNISVVDGQVGWIDPSGHRFGMGIERLSLTEAAVRLAEVDGTVTYDGRMIRLTARTGALEDLRSAFGADPWPVTAKLESGGTTITVDGKIDHPLQGRGYAFTVDGTVPDPSSLEELLPRLPLGALRDVSAHAEVRDSGGPVPTVSALRVTVGSADLDSIRHGLRLRDVTLSGQGGSPLNVAARMTMDGFESAISGTGGDLAWLTSGRTAPIAVDLAWSAATGRAIVRGTIQAPRRLAGYDLNVLVDVPDPALVISDAPAGLKAVLLRARLIDTTGPMPFQLTSTAGDLEGALSVSRSPRWSVEGQVSSQHLDIDMLRGAAGGRAATPVPPAAGNAFEGKAAGAPAGPVANAPSAPPPARPPPPPAKGTPGPVAARSHGPLIPDTKLPFQLIRAMDGNVSFAFAHVQVDGADVRKITGVVSAKDGRLRIDPFNIAAPDQRMNGVLEADAASSPPRVHGSVEAPGLALRPLLAALGLPEVASGLAAVRADLSGTGDTPRAIAGTIDGWAGVAVEDGQLDAQMMNSWLGQLQALHIGGPDISDLRCFAMRADAKAGVVTIEPLALSTPALILEGGGDVDLRDETLALRLRPRTKIGGTGIAVPVRVTGPWRDPSAKIDISGRGTGGALAGLLLGGKDVMGAAGGGDPCPAALARAREGAAEAPGGQK